MMTKTGEKMSLGTLKAYLNAMPNDKRTVEVKVGDKFFDICDISVDFHGNTILYTREQ